MELGKGERGVKNMAIKFRVHNALVVPLFLCQASLLALHF